MNRQVSAWLPPIGWCILIFVFSSREGLPVSLERGTDKIAHFLAYSVLGYLLARARAVSGVSLVVILVFGLMYAASDEWHQSFVPNRSADLFDWIADALGVFAGVLSYHFLQRRSGERRSSPGGIRPDSTPP